MNDDAEGPTAGNRLMAAVAAGELAPDAGVALAPVAGVALAPDEGAAVPVVDAEFPLPPPQADRAKDREAAMAMQ
ncbi:hypothetical protein [Caballeronia sp. 15711]|uniref:hypothetical protein n=1 Tax=Caballeronia sp. 15711 TaxID=3391029 RepID=UPI0039E56126